MSGLRLLRDLSSAERSARGARAKSLVAQIEQKQKLNAARAEINHEYTDTLYAFQGGYRRGLERKPLSARLADSRVARQDMRSAASPQGGFEQFFWGLGLVLKSRLALAGVVAAWVGLALAWAGHLLVGGVLMSVAACGLLAYCVRVVWRERRRLRRAGYFERVAALDGWHERWAEATSVGADPAQAVFIADLDPAPRPNPEIVSMIGETWRAVGTLAMRPGPHDGAVYHAKDAGLVFVGDGKMWHRVEDWV